MKTEPLAKLSVDEHNWINLAASLKKTFPWNTGTDEVIHLCAAYYAHNQKPQISSYSYAYEAQCDKVAFDKLAVDTVAFLKEFMDARGQWGYIEQQGWYTDSKYVIGIDVNYYPNRSTPKYTLSPSFHKDTGGNNLFVNLIFDNAQPIEATEWFVDVQQPSGKRAEWQQKLLPPAHLYELDSLRKHLRGSGKYETPQVHGGVIKGANVYASWVDDLVWHATPSLSERIVYSEAAAVAAWPSIRLAFNTGGTFSFRSQNRAVQMNLVELLGTMADEPATALCQWLASQGKQVQDLDFELARAAWAALYNDDGGQARFTADAHLRGRSPWRLAGEVSQAIATDSRLDQGVDKASSISETPAGLSKVRRANSVDSGELKATKAANKDVPRSFVRTWVRILPKDSKELKDKSIFFN